MEDIIIEQKEDAENTLFKKKDMNILICSILLGVLFDILFYNKPLGISYPLFVIAFYVAFLWNLRPIMSFRISFGWLLTIPIVALSSTYFIFTNQIFAVLNFLIIPFLIIAQTILISEENKYNWYDSRFMMDIFSGVFNRAFSCTSKPFIIGLSSLRIRKRHKKYDVLQKVLIGLGFSIPLLMIIISLLSSADRVFSHFIAEITSSFETINIAIFSLQAMIALVITIIAFSYIWSFTNSNSNLKNQQHEVRETNPSGWDPIISITILSVINCVYVVFAIIQFAYLFASVNNALPPDFTYAEYARRGFFELLMITLINFGLLLSSISFTQKDSKLVARTVQLLHSLLIICTVVILLSAYFRMSLYEAAYGYTYLRVLTHFFMIFLGVLFLIAFYKIWNEHMSLLKPYIVITIVAYMIINFSNIDVLIANKNINRYLETGKLDTYYLRNLSYDSIPELVNLLDVQKPSREIREYLVEQQKKLSKKQSWQSFNLSQHKAKEVLAQYKL
ncbi:DUF4173 domain-containing protein [Desulfosporosinus sp. BG]|uniref:DUF4153 domain-containing protein n=1 Tax=Desulfosporosinus sp. BG TaxID=1633135 RepID=UPI000856A3E3|nr:DUF4173 domain-containing protein [Desulfosporosinus sp. BG]ODA42362.1 hypothetical protein DSBG_0749 [Desulfosporosinus sp. BG]